MKIIHLISSLKIGGAESCLVNFLSQCNPADAHTVIYFHAGPNVERIEALGIKTYQLSASTLLGVPSALINMVRLIRQLQPDLIHSSLWSANFMARFIGWWFRIPVIADLHSDCRYHGKLRNLLDRMTCSMTNRYIAVSSAVKSSFEQEMHQPQLPISLILNGINTRGLERTEQTKEILAYELGIDQGRFIVGAVGRLVPIKQYDFLIRAFAALCRSSSLPMHLIIVGDGPERSRLEALSIQEGCSDCVTLVGARADVFRFYSLFDCFVQSSLSEGMSIALLEALAAGLPIITTSNNEAHEVITHGVNGLLVKPLDTGALAGAISTLMVDHAMRSSMQAENKARAKVDFSLNSMVKKYENCYDQAVGKRLTPPS